ncbi:MAG: glutamate 5-kinase [Candidatus Margulisbacteria bacterium GWF2_35_9]|nr:MAG: glutamate 5-kinase [Candidatus Margulisbacteria bacterium GWF2_35_9]
MIDFKQKNLITIKIGSNILTNNAHQLDLNSLRRLVDQVSFLKKQGKKVIIVTSGAIVCGAEALGIIPKSIEEKQAAAAVGQVILMESYQQFFVRQGIKIAQILLTKDGLTNKSRATLAKNTIEKLLEIDVVPIVNENDTVSVDEIKFSDNDHLSSMVSILLNVDLQIFLTDTDGFYDKDPRVHQDAKIIHSLNDITDNVIDSISDNKTTKGTGGMKSKVKSAKFLLDNNIESIIANGSQENIIIDLFNGKKYGTVCKKGVNNVGC